MLYYYIGKMKMETDNKLIIYTDGACKGNPGPGGIGVIFFDQDHNLVDKFSKYIGDTTNNIAEYKALIYGLEIASKKNCSQVQVFSDSQLMVRQINGEYKVKDKILQSLIMEVGKFIKNFKEFNISHLPRQKNKLANDLAQKACSFKALEG